MNIANPIYDVVFKYLLEDEKVAKLLLGAILDKEIIDIEFAPQEYTAEIKEKSMTVYRVDFKAKIKLDNSETKVVLIELQKAKLLTDIMRFRRYIGKQYSNENNTITIDGKRQALPIITIYFIGYNLDNLKDIPVIYVKREYIDKSTNETIDKRDNFIESLTHDSIIIQIQSVKNKKHKNNLEKILSIFDNAKKHTISIDEDNYPDKYKPITRRLLRAIADDDIVNTMEVEDDILEELQINERKVEELAKENFKIKQEKKQAQEEKKQALIKLAKKMLQYGESLEDVLKETKLNEDDL